MRFVYDEPAMMVKAAGKSYLVVSDLHIGMELGLSHKGIHLFNATDKMSERIRRMMDEFSLGSIIMLGDIKHSILYPDAVEARLLKRFFSELGGFDIRIIAGNHDAHLSEVLDMPVEKDIVIGNFGFFHGNRKPDERMMMLDYLISGHDHIAVRMRDISGAYYEQKAWAIYQLNKKTAKLGYKSFNSRIKLVSMPAFNDLIMGTTIEKRTKNMLNPLLSSNIFDYKSADIYNLFGQRIDLG